MKADHAGPFSSLGASKTADQGRIAATHSLRITAPEIAKRKRNAPLVMVATYTARMAELLDPHCDMLLVGDSVAQVVYRHPSALPASVEMMIAHGAAVVRASAMAPVVVNMPFGPTS